MQYCDRNLAGFAFACKPFNGSKCKSQCETEGDGFELLEFRNFHSFHRLPRNI